MPSAESIYGTYSIQDMFGRKAEFIIQPSKDKVGYVSLTITKFTGKPKCIRYEIGDDEYLLTDKVVSLAQFEGLESISKCATKISSD